MAAVIEPYEKWLGEHSSRKRWTGRDQVLAEALIAVLERARGSGDPAMADLLQNLDRASSVKAE